MRGSTTHRRCPSFCSPDAKLAELLKKKRVAGISFIYSSCSCSNASRLLLCCVVGTVAARRRQHGSDVRARPCAFLFFGAKEARASPNPSSLPRPPSYNPLCSPSTSISPNPSSPPVAATRATMRQAEKQAVVATRNLLKADANRVKKAAAAQARKAAVLSAGRKALVLAHKRKSKFVAMADASEQRSSRWPLTATKEDIVSGFGTTAPTSFTDGSCFFNGSGSIFGGTRQNPAQPWMLPQCSDPATWYISVFLCPKFQSNLLVN
jgi:hypothetical protein